MKTTTCTRPWLKWSIACTLAMLALGASRAIGADASVTAIDILLEPDATMLQHAAATNARLRKVFPKSFALDASAPSSKIRQAITHSFSMGAPRQLRSVEVMRLWRAGCVVYATYG